MRERQSSLMYTVRTAQARDSARVREIDSACFPPGDRDREPAPPGELEEAVLAGDVRILEVDDRPVAYAHADRTSRPERIYISGVGVEPAYQRLGLGSRLIDDCLATLEDQRRRHIPIVTITSPRNLVMLRVIHSRGFRARWILREYFGPGRDRLGCQWSISARMSPPEHLRFVHAADIEGLYPLLDSGRYAVERVSRADEGPCGYHVAMVRASDYPSVAPHW
jgi:ribosomal protein S18 acetylase RimI-like enzyme